MISVVGVVCKNKDKQKILKPSVGSGSGVGSQTIKSVFEREDKQSDLN